MSNSNSKLVDIEPGGESRQYVSHAFPDPAYLSITRYESIRTVTEAPAKQTGQMGGMSGPFDSNAAMIDSKQSIRSIRGVK